MQGTLAPCSGYYRSFPPIQSSTPTLFMCPNFWHTLRACPHRGFALFACELSATQPAGLDQARRSWALGLLAVGFPEYGPTVCLPASGLEACQPIGFWPFGIYLDRVSQHSGRQPTTGWFRHLGRHTPPLEMPNPAYSLPQKAVAIELHGLD